MHGVIGPRNLPLPLYSDKSAKCMTVTMTPVLKVRHLEGNSIHDKKAKRLEMLTFITGFVRRPCHFMFLFALCGNWLTLLYRGLLPPLQPSEQPKCVNL